MSPMERVFLSMMELLGDYYVAGIKRSTHCGGRWDNKKWVGVIGNWVIGTRLLGFSCVSFLNGRNRCSPSFKATVWRIFPNEEPILFVSDDEIY